MYSSNGTACALAKRALSMMGEEVPRRILSCVPNWKTCEVQTWLQQVGFSTYCDRFQVGKNIKEIHYLHSDIQMYPTIPPTAQLKSGSVSTVSDIFLAFLYRSCRWTETSC